MIIGRENHEQVERVRTSTLYRVRYSKFRGITGNGIGSVAIALGMQIDAEFGDEAHEVSMLRLEIEQSLVETLGCRAHRLCCLRERCLHRQRARLEARLPGH